MLPAELGGAAFSPDERYRYRLWRKLGPSPGRCVFVMLNPSTADAAVDDPTIRRCVRFALRERCGRLDVVNLYAFRSPAPESLNACHDPIGPDNDHHIYSAFAGWGAFTPTFGGHYERTRRVIEIAQRAGVTRLQCLGSTRDDSPRHPLFVRRDQPLLDWWRA